LSCDDFGKASNTKITITIHEALAEFVYKGKKQ
jgi:hypothetical protein